LTVQHTSARKATLALLAIAGLLLATFVAAVPVLADHDGPSVTATVIGQSENPNCDDILGVGNYDEEQKFDPPNSGTQGHVTFTNDDDVASFEAADGWLVLVAIIKGGNEGGNLYDYSGLGGVDHDNNLVTGDAEQGISHATFCLVQEDEESEPQSEPASEPASEPEGSVGGGTGTPAASVPDTATSLQGIGGPLATLVFGAILVASLGALAYANVAAARRRG
jgi:hypothetical protein